MFTSKLSIRSLCILTAVFALSSCFKKIGDDENDDDAPINTGPTYDFGAPVTGQLISVPVTLSVSGDGIANATFEVDGNTRFVDGTAPFEWVFDPEIFRLGDRTLNIIARDGTGRDVAHGVRIRVVRPPVPVADIQTAIANLQPGEWYQIHNSHMRDVGFPWNDVSQNVASIVDNVSGGAFDTKRNRLVLFGGGQIYAGNEMYSFDMDTFSWSRLTDPALFPPGQEGNPFNLVQHADGSPVSRESFDQMAYIPPPIDRFFLGGGTALWRSGQFWDFHSYFFDFDTLHWESRTDTMTSMGPGSITATAPDGRVWMHGTGSNSTEWPYLSVYDPVANTWTRFTKFPTFFENRSTAEIEPVRNWFVAVGRIDSATLGATYYWDLNTPDPAPVKLATSGATEVENGLSPGLAYHPGMGKLVSWSGGKDAYSLDLGTGVWTKHSGVGAEDPQAASPRGTFGRWAYVPSLDRFIVVNNVDSNVYVYRLQ